MADPTTPIPNFTLNLEPNVEPVSPIVEEKHEEPIVTETVGESKIENQTNEIKTENNTIEDTSFGIELPEIEISDGLTSDTNQQDITPTPIEEVKIEAQPLNIDAQKPEELTTETPIENNTTTETNNDDRLNKEDSLVEASNIQTENTEKNENSLELPSEPIGNETAATKNEEEIIDNPNTFIPEPQEENLEISSKPEEIITETPIENDTTPPTDNTETIEAPTQDTTNTEVNSENNIVSAVESGTTETNTQATEVQAQKIEEAPSLSKDMDIIKNIQNTNAVVQASTPSSPTVSSTPNTIDTMPKIPANNSFNLDSLQVQIPQIPQPTTTVIPPAPSPIPTNPYDNLQKIIPQIAPTTNIPATNNNTMKIASTIGTIVFILLVRFVTKTMYPLQYKDFINNITGGENEETISTEIGSGDISLSGDSLLFSGDTSLSGDSLLSGDNILLGSGNDILDDTVIDSGSTENSTEEDTNHNSPTTSTLTEEFTTKLQTFSAQGKDALEQAKSTNNKTTIKYSLSLYKKAEGYLLDLANGDQITSDRMIEIESELSSYLSKISGSRTNETPTNVTEPEPTQQNEQKTNTGGNFDPDTFFGNN